MEIALILSLIALAVALPGCIADSLTVIEKLRARRANRLLKKSEIPHAYHSFVFSKKADVDRPIDICQVTHPDSDHLALGAFLKTLAR
ncbi:MAG: hypothetical protein M3362_01230 [Acidobacteriota bacterium]|nr:hypothetical protein [Acidobacteriota bacterium]